MRSRAPIRSLTAAALVLAGAFSLAGGARAGTVPCPTLDPTLLLGPLAQRENRAPFAARQLSGLAVSSDNADAVTGQQIVWAIGDRKANEAVAAGNDRVYLFGYDAADGSMAIRFRLRAGAFPDDPANTPDEPDGITSFGHSPNPVPDLEDLSIEYREGADLLWLFDTGDNAGIRNQLYAYRILEPDLTPAGRGLLGETGTDPELDDAIEGGKLRPTRFPIKVWANAAKTVRARPNVEAAFVDVGAPTSPAPIYLIPRVPFDGDGDGMNHEMRLFRVDSPLNNKVNHATPAGWIRSGASSPFQPIGASILPGGSAFAVRAGTPANDRILTFTREPGVHISDHVAAGNHDPACSWNDYNTNPNANTEESIAFDLVPGGGWDGFLWTHDGTDFPPLYRAPFAPLPPA